MNDAFTGPFWNLDQVLAWIGTRDPGLARFASASKQTGRIRNTYEIAVQANRTATETKKAAGQDINAELWAISGWAKPTHPYPTPMAEEHLAEELGVPPYLLASYKNIAVQWPLQQEAVALLNAWLTASPVEQQVLTGLFKFHQTEDSILNDTLLTRLSAEMRQLLVAYISRREAHGPPHIVRFDPFPTIEYLQRLFCVGNLKAIGNLPIDPIGRVIEAKDWGGLEIAVGGELRRLGARFVAQFFLGPFGPGLSFLVNDLTSFIAGFFLNPGAAASTIFAPASCEMNPPFSSIAARISLRASSSEKGAGGSAGNSLNTSSRATRTCSMSPWPSLRKFPSRQT